MSSQGTTQTRVLVLVLALYEYRCGHEYRAVTVTVLEPGPLHVGLLVVLAVKRQLY